MIVGGDRGAGARENRGREGYGRRERKGREAGVPKGREAGEIGENYVTLHTISQSKKGKREEAKKKGAGAGIARYGRREVWTPPPPMIARACSHTFLLQSNIGSWLDLRLLQNTKNIFLVLLINPRHSLFLINIQPDIRALI